MREFFLYLSERRGLENFISKFPPTRKLVDRFVAGRTLDEAMQVVKALNSEGIRVTLDRLGESVVDKSLVDETVSEYLKILDVLKGTPNSVAVKPTSVGLDISKEVALDNFRKLLQKGDFIEIDMEASKYVDDTLWIYRKLKEEFPDKKIAVAIQAYLYRSEKDVRDLTDLNPYIRLVKGAYKEPKDVAIQDKKKVDENYVKLLFYLLENIPYTLVATHDENIINRMLQFVKEKNIPTDRFEFQFLYGIKSNLLRQLKKQGYNAAMYVPYGTHWYPYFMRRLAERPANVWFVFKNLFG